MSLLFSLSKLFYPFQQFDEGKNVFEGELTSEDLTSFVRKNSLSVVTEFGEEVTNLAKNYDKHMGILF